MINPNPKNRGFYFGHDYFIFSMSNHNIEVKEGIFQRLLLTRFVFENFFSYKLLTHWPCPWSCSILVWGHLLVVHTPFSLVLQSAPAPDLTLGLFNPSHSSHYFKGNFCSATNEVPFLYLSTNLYYLIKIVPFCFPFQFKVLFLRYLAI